MYWYASDLYLKDWGGLSDSYPYMHCTRSTKKSDLMSWYARHLCWIDGGVSLVTLNSKEFTQCSGSFKWGVHHQFYLGKSENLSLFQVLLLLPRSLSFL